MLLHTSGLDPGVFQRDKTQHCAGHTPIWTPALPPCVVLHGCRGAVRGQGTCGHVCAAVHPARATGGGAQLRGMCRYPVAHYEVGNNHIRI